MMKKSYFYSSKIKSVTEYILLFICGMYSLQTIAQPNLILSAPVISGLSQPIQFVNAADGTGRVFIVEKAGAIKVYNSAFASQGTFLTVTGINASGEEGLLSMAFHPDYENNGFFYVFYTTNNGNLQIARYKVSTGDPNMADVSSKDTVITIPHPGNSNHNGGELQFGNDGYLYLSTGDGGGGGDQPNNAQNQNNLLGKIIRLNVNTSETSPFYTLPAGNPFGNEVYCLGLRNPYRWSFDRLTNDMWIGDVGQDEYEEISMISPDKAAGANFGWRCYEGPEQYNPDGCGDMANYIFPVHSYSASSATTSVTGGVVYRGTTYPAMYGWYFGCDFYTNTFYKIRPNGAGGWSVFTQSISPNNIVDFGETEAGEVYVVSLGSGTVYRLTTNTILPLSMMSFNVMKEKEGVQLNWQTALEENMSHFEVEYSKDGKEFEFLTEVKAKNNSKGDNYSYDHQIKFDGMLYYRLKMIDNNNVTSYSDIRNVQLISGANVTINPTLITNSQLNLIIKDGISYKYLDIINIAGDVVMNEDISARSGELSFNLSTLSKGMYIVKLTGNGPAEVHKIMIQ